MTKATIIIDTREKMPLDFDGFDGIKTKVHEFWPGDYSVRGFPRKLAIERKSVSDLIGTMKSDYAGFDATTPKRFDRTLLGLRGTIALGGHAAVIVEPDHMAILRRLGYKGGEIGAEEQIRRGLYRSQLPPVCVMAFIRTIRSAWGVPVIMTESREHSAAIVAEMARLVVTIGKPPRKVSDALSAMFRQRESCPF